MNEILENRVLRRHLTLFIGVTLTVGVATIMERFHRIDLAIMGYPGHRLHLSWFLITFVGLFAAGIVLAVASTRWHRRLGVASGGLFLAGVLLIADAALFNYQGLIILLPEFHGPHYSGWLAVIVALLSALSVLALGYWRFRAEVGDRDGKVIYTIVAALLPLLFVGEIALLIVHRHTFHGNSQALWISVGLFLVSVVLLGAGVFFSRRLKVLGSVLSLSGVIMAFESAFVSVSTKAMLSKALAAIAIAVAAALIGYVAFLRRGETVERLPGVEPATKGEGDHADTELVLHFSGDIVPGDARLVEVPLGDGLVFRGFATRRPKT
jgi:hypothetical protein